MRQVGPPAPRLHDDHREVSLERLLLQAGVETETDGAPADYGSKTSGASRSPRPWRNSSRAWGSS